MRLLLDTHVLLWWHDQPARLTETVYSAINDLGNDVFLRVVNGWEIQIKAQLGKLTPLKPLGILLQEEQASSSNDPGTGQTGNPDLMAHGRRAKATMAGLRVPNRGDTGREGASRGA